jgi:hypothetical protein
MNRTEELQDLAFDNKKPVNKSLDGEESEKEKRAHNLVGDITNENNVSRNSENRKHRTPNKTQIIRTRYVMVRGKKYKFNFK